MADAVVRARAHAPMETTAQLSELVCACYPPGQRTNGHPAKRTFQAIRIEVNAEPSIIPGALSALIDMRAPHGRVAVITFHSLEDKLVKAGMRRAADPCTCPKNFPVCICGKTPLVKILTKKPIEHSDSELAANRRAQSAKLRVCEKLS